MAITVLKGIPFLRQELTKLFMKKAAEKSGIMTVPFKNKKLQLDIEDRLQKYIRDAEKQGVDLDMVSNENLKYTINLNENVDPISRAISADSSEGKAITDKLFGKKGDVVDMTGKKIDTSQGIMGGKSVKELMESGQVQKGTDDIKISEKITDREMFKNSNLNKTDAQIKAEIEASNKKSLSKMETNNFSLNTITKIKSMKPMDAIKEANLVAGKKGRYANLDDNQVKKIIDDTTDHIFERDIPIDPDDMAKGGRAGYAVGNQVTPQVDARMQNSYDYNVRRNNAERTLNQMSRNYDFSGLSTLGLNAKTYDSTPGPMRGIPAIKGMREKMIQDIMGRTQSGYTPAPKPKPKTYRTVSPEAQALNMSQSTYEDIISSGKDPKQYYIDYQNRMMTEGGNYGTPGTSSYTGPQLLKYGQVIGGPGMMSGIAGPGTAPGATPPTQAQINQMISNNPMGYADFADLVKTYSADPYKGLQEEIKDMVDGRDTGYMSAQDYYDINVLGLDGQGIAEKYGFEYAKGGRAGYYTGGMVDVEPNLSDIGHGSDALMARTRLVAPDSQATTSTGLNYLLAEDNDNIRVPFAKGKLALADAARRKFMKTAGGIGAGIAALKTGLLGFADKAAPVVQKAVETVSETAQGVPPYFLNLVNKIRKMGESTLATKDKANAYKFKDYVMEEDFAGNIEIIKKGDDVAEDVYMSYKVDEVPVKKGGSSKVEEYEEYTARPDGEGKMKDIEQGVPDEVVQEGTMFEDDFTDFGKADGGRIGFSVGGGKFLLSKLGITGSSRRFLEKIFGKGNLDEMIKRDPEMHRGLLEVTEMFRNRDKEGLKAYMKNFLPHMDDTQIEEFIVGDAVDSAGQAKFGLGDMQGQLIRLGSGRDYKAKIEAIKKLEDAQKLDTLDVTEEMIRKPNAFGGIQTMLGE